MNNAPIEVINEIKKHDIDSFKKVSLNHEAVVLALAYLKKEFAIKMADRLTELAGGGFIRIGPLDGFVAATVILGAEEFIFLSDLYPDYLTDIELMASLVHEIGLVIVFNRPSQENELRAQRAIDWFNASKKVQKSMIDTQVKFSPKLEGQSQTSNSIISMAAQKAERKTKVSLIDVLLADKIITEEQCHDVRERQKIDQKPLHDILVEWGFVTDLQIAQEFSKMFDMPVYEIKNFDIDVQVTNMLTFDQVRRYSAYPIKYENDFLLIAMSNPHDLVALEDLNHILGKNLKPILVSRLDILHRIESVDANDEAVNSLLHNSFESDKGQASSFIEANSLNSHEKESASELLTDMEKKEKGIPAFPNLPPEFQSLLQSESPTVKLVNLVLADALKVRASDVHIEPRENFIEIRYRVDGDLRNILKIPMKFHIKVVARVKILATLDITKNAIPQDGRIQLIFEGRKVDFRVSTIPTFYGEKIVIRILDAAAAKTELDNLGFNQAEKNQFIEAVKSPQGMVLVTGPTGSGKTSTLYAALNFVKSESTNIITIEDPIEFINEGINQIQVNPARGVTFASGLRSILRQDPNVILLGEIRDKETADIALKASITGHLLLSTLHTNSCVATITRLADIGMDYYQIASALVMVVSQRLVKTICPDCKMEFNPDEEYRKKFSDEIEQFKLTKFYKGKGCAKCNYTGYKGRTAVFEVLRVTESVKNIIAKGLPEEDMLKEAKKAGFKSLIEAGTDKVQEGITTLDEIVKHLGNVEHVNSVAQKTEDSSVPVVEPSLSLDPNRKKKILVVDDEEVMRKILLKNLQTAGYDVILAVNGQEAIEKVFKEKPDLIITDFSMPVMNGLEEIKILRSKVETAVIPVIMLTADQDKNSELNVINAGADDYITKPFDREKLLVRVSMLLRRVSLRNT